MSLQPTIVYIYPAADGVKHTELALRFIQTYNRFPPGGDHKTIVVLNGAKRETLFEAMFASIPNVEFLERDDSGWDIGGYQDASKHFPAELMVFFGGSAYFKKPGWLPRIVSAYQKYGPGIYGATVNRGDPRRGVYMHIRTTGFWMPSELLNKYPEKVIHQEQRYPFEHGPNNITTWVKKQGLRARLVTWFGEYLWENWDDPYPMMYHNGQPALLFADRITDLMGGIRA